jgi:hypothetical protein
MAEKMTCLANGGGGDDGEEFLILLRSMTGLKTL